MVVLVSYVFLDVLVACALVLYLRDDGDISPKHAGQFMYMDDL
jgi:hypothetical protein